MKVAIKTSPEFQRAFLIHQIFGPPYSIANKFFFKEILYVIFPEFRNICDASKTYMELNKNKAKEFWDEILGYKKSGRLAERILEKLSCIPVNEDLPKWTFKFLTKLNLFMPSIKREIKSIFGIKTFPAKVDIWVREFETMNSKSLSGAMLHSSKIAIGIGISRNTHVNINRIIDTFVHELIHGLFLLNNFKNSFWLGSKFEECLLDYFTPHGILSEKLKIARKELKTSERQDWYKEYTKILDPLMKSYEKGNVFKFLYRNAGNTKFWRVYKKWYEKTF